MPDTQIQNGSNQPSASTGFGALARIGWMVVGTVLILSLGMAIASRPAWSLGIRDVLFWGAVLATGLLRYIDVTRLDGQTANGGLATNTHLQRYLVGLVVVSTALWVAAQSIGL
jgi:hypothetical protein